jgi:protein-disulfide isomerase
VGTELTSPTVPSRRPPGRRLPVILALGLVGLLIGTAIVFIAVGEGGRRIEINGASETQRIYGGILQDGDELGSPDAPVKISYFTDLQCESCAGYHFATIPPLIDELVRDGEAKLSLRHYSTGENETQAAAFAATAAGLQERQWQYAHLFFRNLDQADDGRITEDLLRGVAGAVLELDDSDWQEAIDTDEVSSRVEADAALAIELLLPAQPAMLIEGPGGSRKLTRSPSPAEIEVAVEEVR